MIGADIRGRPLTPDMLLARRQREAVGAPSRAVARLTDQASRHLPDMRISPRQKSESGTPELQRHPEALPLADRYIHSQRSRRPEYPKRERLRRDRYRERACPMRHLGNLAERFDHPERIRIAAHRAQQFV